MFRGFTQKKVHSYTLGEQLKNLRNEGRITLHEVSRETRIPLKYLEKIEEGKYESLPPDVYVKGFLRGYAEFLGIDPKNIVRLYEREKEIKNSFHDKEEKKQTRKKTAMPKFIVTPRMIIAAAVFFVVAGGFTYLYREIGRFASVPRLVVTNPSGDESVEGNSITVAGFTDSDAKLSINGQPVLVSDRGEFRENILLQPGNNSITLSATNRFSKVAEKTLNIMTDYDQPEFSQNPDEGESSREGQVIGEQDVKAKKVRIIVRIDAVPSWLSIESDGNLVYSGTMLSGAIQEFEGEREIRVTSGKANQTYIKVNGKEERLLDSSPGIVRDVVFGPND